MPDPFLQSYSGQTADELLALEGKYRTDSLVLAFEQAIQLKSRPSRDEAVVLAVEAMEREVNNGGFSQFFLNSSAEFASVLENALRSIGCPKTADIARDAIAAIATDGDLTAQVLSEAAADLDEHTEQALSACDQRYFANDEPLADRLFQWIKANRSAIRIGDA